MAGFAPVICDTGSAMIKAGFAGDNWPSMTVPTLLGRSEQGNLIGDELLEFNALRPSVQPSRPMQNGIVGDWEDMEALWEFTFRQLGADPPQHKIVQTVQTLQTGNSRAMAYKMVEVMFERFQFQGLSMPMQATCALLSQGSTTGLVLDAGDDVTTIAPVCEGFLHPSSVMKVPLAGRHVTQYLMHLLVGQGHPINSSTDLDTVRKIKESLCYVAYDPAKERKLSRDTTFVEKLYSLPDSRQIRVGAERFLAPELLFEPSLYGHGDGKGLAGCVFDAVSKAATDIRQQLYENILVSGGTTMLPGFSSRLETEIRNIRIKNVFKGVASQASNYPCCVYDLPFTQHLAFLGASWSASIELENPAWWISKDEYKERGTSVADRLFPTEEPRRR